MIHNLRVAVVGCVSFHFPLVRIDKFLAARLFWMMESVDQIVSDFTDGYACIFAFGPLCGIPAAQEMVLIFTFFGSDAGHVMFERLYHYVLCADQCVIFALLQC